MTLKRALVRAIEDIETQILREDRRVRLGKSNTELELLKYKRTNLVFQLVQINCGELDDRLSD